MHRNRLSGLRLSRTGADAKSSRTGGRAAKLDISCLLDGRAGAADASQEIVRNGTTQAGPSDMLVCVDAFLTCLVLDLDLE